MAHSADTAAEQARSRLENVLNDFERAAWQDHAGYHLSGALDTLHRLGQTPWANMAPFRKEAEQLHAAVARYGPVIASKLLATPRDRAIILAALQGVARITARWAIGDGADYPGRRVDRELVVWLRNYCHNLSIEEVLPEFIASADREQLAVEAVADLFARIQNREVRSNWPRRLH